LSFVTDVSAAYRERISEAT